MVQTATHRPVRRATPERWQAALKRALEAGVQIRQLAGSGAWVATSATDPAVAYLVNAQSCECQAAEHGDPVCLHRAMYWNAVGVLDLEPEPAAAPFDSACSGHRVAGTTIHCPCARCDGSGAVTVSVVLAA